MWLRNLYIHHTLYIVFLFVYLHWFSIYMYMYIIFTISGIIRKTSYTLICYVLCIPCCTFEMKWSKRWAANIHLVGMLFNAPHRHSQMCIPLYFSFSYIYEHVDANNTQHTYVLFDIYMLTVILKLCSIYKHIHIWPKQNHFIQKHSSFIFTALWCTSHNKSHTLNAFISNASSFFFNHRYLCVYIISFILHPLIYC